MVRLERRITQPWWLSVAVPVLSVLVALAIGAIVLLVTGHDPLHVYSRILDRGFVASGALTATLTTATPLLYTGLAAAIAFRMNLFNIGGEGQLYMGAIAGSGVGLAIGGSSAPVLIISMMLAGAVGGALWALIPAVLKAFASTNEIITSLMLNYVAGLVMTYLIFDSLSFWRDTSSPDAKVFPQGKELDSAAIWPHFPFTSPLTISLPFGFLLAVVLALVLHFVIHRTRFGFELGVIGDSPRAARYAGMSPRRKILSVMAVSGGLAGLGGASQIGDFRHELDAKGLDGVGYGYAGIVVAALARYNPIAVVVVAILLGGLRNAGFSLQGADFPSGLVGMLQGLILFAALGGELLVNYRVRRSTAQPSVAESTA